MAIHHFSWHLIARAPIRQGGCWSVVDHIEILKPNMLRASEKLVVICGNDIESIRLKWYVLHILTQYTMIKLLFGAAKLWSRAYIYICIETNLEQSICSICIYSILSLYTYLTWVNYDQFFLIMFRDVSFSAICFFKQKNLRCQFSESQSKFVMKTAGHQPAWNSEELQMESIHRSDLSSFFIGWWCLQMVDGLWWFFILVCFCFLPVPKMVFFLNGGFSPWHSGGFRGRRFLSSRSPRREAAPWHLVSQFRVSAATQMKITSPTSPTNR